MCTCAYIGHVSKELIPGLGIQYGKPHIYMCTGRLMLVQLYNCIPLAKGQNYYNHAVVCFLLCGFHTLVDQWHKPETLVPPKLQLCFLLTIYHLCADHAIISSKYCVHYGREYTTGTHTGVRYIPSSPQEPYSILFVNIWHHSQLLYSIGSVRASAISLHYTLPTEECNLIYMYNHYFYPSVADLSSHHHHHVTTNCPPHSPSFFLTTFMALHQAHPQSLYSLY